MLAFFSFIVCPFCDLSEKTLSNPMSQRFSYVIFSKFSSFSPCIQISGSSRFSSNIISPVTLGSVHQTLLLQFLSLICTFTSKYLIVITGMFILLSTIFLLILPPQLWCALSYQQVLTACLLLLPPNSPVQPQVTSEQES